MKPGIYATVRIARKDRGGSVEFVREEPAHSFVRNFGKGMYASFLRGRVQNAYVRTNGGFCDAFLRNSSYGGAGTFVYDSGWLLHPAPAGEIRGVVVGASGESFDIGQYDLQSRIPHGSVDGSFIYGAQSQPVVAVADDNSAVTLTISREFGNAGGTEVSVAEVGLMAYPTITASAPWNGFSGHGTVLLTRDVLESPIVVSPGMSLAVSHVLRGVF